MVLCNSGRRRALSLRSRHDPNTISLLDNEDGLCSAAVWKKQDRRLALCNSPFMHRVTEPFSAFEPGYIFFLVCVIRRGCKDVIKDGPFLGSRSIPLSHTHTYTPPTRTQTTRETRRMAQRADMVYVDAKVVPEKKLTFDCNMDTTSVNQPFDLLSYIEAR